MSHFFLSLTFLCVSVMNVSAVYAQTSRSGDIENMEVEIVRERQIILSKTTRDFEKIPPHTISSARPRVSYKFKPVEFTIPAYKALVRPMKLIPEPIQKIYGNFVAMGFGNYLAPYLEASVNNKRNKKYSYGGWLYHRSAILGPVDGDKSGSYLTRAKITGALYGKVFHGEAYLNYDNQIGYFYGYPSDIEKEKESITQIYNRFGVGGSFSNAKTDSRFSFKFDPTFSYLFNRTGATESELSLRFKGGYDIADKGTILLSSDYFFNVRNDTQSRDFSRHLFIIRPAFSFTPLPKLLVTAGTNMIVNNDPSQGTSFHIYPHVKLRYNIIKNLYAHTSITGDFDKISLHNLSKENFWLTSNVDLKHTNRSYEYTLGVSAKLGKRIILGTGFSIVNLKSLYLYRNSPSDQSKFDVRYGDFERINVYVDARYEKNEKIVLNARGDYYHYSPTSTRLWHKPTYRVSVGGTFDIYRKIMLDINFIGHGGMLAYDDTASQEVELTPALELDFRLSYFISQRIAVFVKLENILSSNYPIYLHYKARGIQVIAGATWSF